MGITIEPTGGLSNYLRVIFSYYQYTRQKNIQLNCVGILEPMNKIISDKIKQKIKNKQK